MGYENSPLLKFVGLVKSTADFLQKPRTNVPIICVLMDAGAPSPVQIYHIPFWLYYYGMYKHMSTKCDTYFF